MNPDALPANLPRRFLTATLLAAGVSMTLLFVVMVAFEFSSLRQDLVRDTEVAAGIMSETSTAALMFGDAIAARETLAALKHSPQVSSAEIFNRDGRLLAYYRRDGAREAANDRSPKASQRAFSASRFTLAEPVLLDNEVQGWIVLRAELGAMYTALARFVIGLLLVVTAAVGAALAMTRGLRRAVAGAEERLRRQALNDAVTGLPNRNAFQHDLRQDLLHAQRTHESVAVLFLDLDNFKVINDSLGHAAGDTMLVEVARRLQECLRESDTVYRLGGDEFTLIARQGKDAIGAAIIAEKLCHALAQPIVLSGKTVHTSVSVGISIYPDDAGDAETLVKNADTAMYHAKERGKNNFQFFSPSMEARAHQRLAMEAALREGLARGEFRLLYQPQIELESGTVHCVEALLRWRHPRYGLLTPDGFLPVAEETGLVVALGGWVLDSACAQAAAWNAAGVGPLKIAVNLSGRELRDARLVETVSDTLSKHGMHGNQLELEVTESMLLEDLETVRGNLVRLQELGISVAIDDFGTGYSSLSHLKSLPVTKLKIDRSFVRDVTIDPDDAAITATIIALSHRLGLEVTAEGVETEAQRDFLRGEGCDTLQGYLIGKPMEPDKVVQMLEREAGSTPGGA